MYSTAQSRESDDPIQFNKVYLHLCPPRSSSFLACPLVYRICQSYPPPFFHVAYTIFLRFACMITSNKDCFCTHTIDYRTHNFNLIGHGGGVKVGNLGKKLTVFSNQITKLLLIKQDTRPTLPCCIPRKLWVQFKKPDNKCKLNQWSYSTI